MCRAEASFERAAISICSISHSCKASRLPWYLRRGAPGQECPQRQVPVFLYACALVSVHYSMPLPVGLLSSITMHMDFIQMELGSEAQFGLKLQMQALNINIPLIAALKLSVCSVVVNKLTKDLLRGNSLCSCGTETACIWTFHPALTPHHHHLTHPTHTYTVYHEVCVELDRIR